MRISAPMPIKKLYEYEPT